MVDKTWDPESAQSFTSTEQILEDGVTSVTRAIYVRELTADGATINLKFRDSPETVAVPLQEGEIYPFGITTWSLGTASSADIWGLW